jgi:hypothetical protein
LIQPGIVLARLGIILDEILLAGPGIIEDIAAGAALCDIAIPVEHVETCAGTEIALLKKFMAHSKVCVVAPRKQSTYNTTLPWAIAHREDRTRAMKRREMRTTIALGLTT